MAERRQHRVPSLLVRSDQPLIGLILKEDSREVVRYFAEETEADAAIPQDATRDALSLAGAWSELSWAEMEKGLDRIRHESPPSPPIAL
ncbi:MAG: hypothetical protein Q7O66_00225 [Dehalococcoidia bacterium]|nr:hypothetical protein [Dehalococcoidia bacterium]